MDETQKEQLADQLFRAQPHVVASLLVQKQLGVSLEKMDFLVNILLICFQAMKESGMTWPLITEEEQERQMGRFVATVHFGDDPAREFSRSCAEAIHRGSPGERTAGLRKC